MMKLLMGTHTEIREFLIDYVENELPALRKYQFRIHLLLCTDCSAYLRKYNTSVKLSQNYLQNPPPEELVNLTLKFLEERMTAEEREADPYPCH